MSRVRAVVVTAMVLLLCGACVGLPDEGEVRTAPQPERSNLDQGVLVAPAPPRRGEEPRDIVRHFLDAMMANPLQTDTARQFLTDEANEAWKPERRTITYAGPITPVGQATVAVDLDGANWLDAHGMWQGSLPASAERLTFPMGLEDGEWRIDAAPDALIVHDSFFQDRFQQLSLFFFDPTARLLVPEPVFVPRGSQLATSLVRGLLQGPPGQAGGSTTSFFPRGSSLADVSVPVSNDGVAQVALRGELASTDDESLELMTAQIAWTLRQDPTVEAVRISIGGDPVTLAGGQTEFPVQLGSRYDPQGTGTSGAVFGLRNGRMVSVSRGETTPVSGPFGSTEFQLRDVATDLQATLAAGVTADGSSLLVAPVGADAEQRERVVVRGASDLARPAWDAAGHLWTVDRRPGGARVTVVVGRRARPVRVPGISGRSVVDLLVSRDGSRLVAIIDRPEGDVVVLSRLTWSSNDVRATRARAIARGEGRRLAVRDIAWRSPTEVLVLTSLSRELSEVRTVSVDGSPATQRGVSPVELLREDARQLVGSPMADTAAWAVTADGRRLQLAPVVDADTIPTDLQMFTYVG
jgi:hypothetical protein